MYWKNSYNYGKQMEQKVLPVIRSYFNQDIQASVSDFARHDFFDEEQLYELKSRTNPLRKYPTTMITENKMTDIDKPLMLLFNFTDCLAYIKYDAETFKQYEKKSFSRANVDWDEKPHLYIPIEHLSVIHNW
jgi:hypothetical protein